MRQRREITIPYDKAHITFAHHNHKLYGSINLVDIPFVFQAEEDCAIVQLTFKPNAGEVYRIHVKTDDFLSYLMPKLYCMEHIIKRKKRRGLSHETQRLAGDY